MAQFLERSDRSDFTPESAPPRAPSSWSDAELQELMSVAHRQALRWSRSQQDAEDIVQEAMLRLVLDGRIGHPHAWLAVVARRLAWRLDRERQRETVALAEERRQAMSARPAAPPNAHMELQSLLAHASPHDRRLLLLDAAGFTDEEISHRVGCRSGSVHTLLTRARERLRHFGAE